MLYSIRDVFAPSLAVLLAGGVVAVDLFSDKITPSDFLLLDPGVSGGVPRAIDVGLIGLLDRCTKAATAEERGQSAAAVKQCLVAISNLLGQLYFEGRGNPLGLPEAEASAPPDISSLIDSTRAICQKLDGATDCAAILEAVVDNGVECLSLARNLLELLKELSPDCWRYATERIKRSNRTLLEALGLPLS